MVYGTRSNPQSEGGITMPKLIILTIFLILASIIASNFANTPRPLWCDVAEPESPKELADYKTYCE